jgi:membrane protease YdiL (CAAX protease family)
MSSEILQLSISMVITAGYFVLIWLVTKFYKPESLEVKFANSWKEAALAMGYIIGLFLIIAAVFFFMEQSAGGPVGTPRQFDVRRALSQWGVYAIISFIPISVIVKIRKQSFETIGLTRKNVKLSLGIGLVLSLLLVSLSITSEQFLCKFFTHNTLYAFTYFSAVGLGEEIMFRGFLQLRCSIWLGEIKGLILASAIMAFVHLPQRIFVVGLDPLQAFGSAISLIPISTLMGFFMLRTQNISGPAVLHTIVNWVSVLYA